MWVKVSVTTGRWQDGIDGALQEEQNKATVVTVLLLLAVDWTGGSHLYQIAHMKLCMDTHRYHETASPLHVQ